MRYVYRSNLINTNVETMGFLYNRIVFLIELKNIIKMITCVFNFTLEETLV